MSTETSSSLSVNIQCLEALETLHAALGLFANRGTSCLELYDRKFQSKWSELTHSLHSLQARVDSIKDELASLDYSPDEETGEDLNAERRSELRNDLSPAQDRVDDLTAAMGQVQDAYEEFQRRTREFAELAGEHVPRSQGILQQHIDAINHYQSIKPNLGANQPSAINMTSAAQSHSDATNPTSGSDLPGSVISDRGVDSLRGMIQLTPKVWISLNDEERVTVVQEIEYKLANVQGRPAVPVVAEKMDSRTYGYFDEHAIHINTKMWDDISETVDTIAHEGRHAYQHYAIKHPMFHSNVEEVASWRNNNIPGNYLSAEKYGQARYKAQPIEADAWTYASAIRLRLYPLGGD